MRTQNEACEARTKPRKGETQKGAYIREWTSIIHSVYAEQGTPITIEEALAKATKVYEQKVAH